MSGKCPRFSRRWIPSGAGFAAGRFLPAFALGNFMPRQARVVVAGVPRHVIQGGNDRQEVLLG
jgi:hypothetical protein